MIADARETRTIHTADANVCVGQRLGDLQPNRFGTFAVTTPWGIKHDQPLAFGANVQEAIA